MASFTCLSRNFDQRFTSFLRELGRLSCLLVVGGQVELDAVGPTPHYPHRYRLREKQLRRALSLHQARGPRMSARRFHHLIFIAGWLRRKTCTPTSRACTPMSWIWLQ